MAGEWEKSRLGDLVKITHGWPFKSECFTENRAGRPIIVSIGNFKYTGGFRFESTTIKEYTGDYPNEYELIPDDILLVMTCQTSGGEILGIPARIPDDGNIYLHNQRMGKVVIKDKDRIDPGFVYYLALWPDFNRELCVTASGTKILHTAPVRIEAFEFNLPPLTEQRAIAEVLGALDDKIELNRRMNSTLEATARALFQSWFVDFDPVRAKLDGRQPFGLDQATAALFPEHFEDSQIGKKPIGWDVTTLEHVLTVLETGGRPKGGVSGFTSGIPSIGAESIVGVGIFDFAKTKFVPIEFYEGMKKGHIESHDVLLYKDGGRPGEYEPHVGMFGDGFPFDKCSINEHVYRLRTNDNLSQEYLYFWMTSEFALAEMRIKGTGVAIPGLNSSAVRSLAVLVPPPPIVEAFTKQAAPLVTRILSSAKQSLTLSTLRDTLLPKLLSGEITTSNPDITQS